MSYLKESMDSQSPEGRENLLRGARERSNLTSALARLTAPRSKLSLIVIGTVSQQTIDPTIIARIQEVAQNLSGNTSVLPLGGEVAVVLNAGPIEATEAANSFLQLNPQTSDLIAGVSVFNPGGDQRDYTRVIDRTALALSDARELSTQGKKISLNIHHSSQAVVANLGPLARKVSILGHK